MAPVDLFFFYIYMRDQQRSVDYLDFWLDVAQHMSMCRHYVRELRRSVMIGTPEGDKSGSKRSSALLENLGNMDHPAGGPSMMSSEKERNQDSQMSAFLRSEGTNGNGVGDSPSNSLGSNNIHRTSSNERRPRASFMNSSNNQTSESSPEHTVNRPDIRQSAEKILYTYLLPGAEREIGIPDELVQEIIISIEEHGRDDPEVFDAAKDYVFQAMERDAFPGFLRAKALGNLVPTSLTLRLAIGLLAMFGAFWTGFILIFLEYGRDTRAWLMLPFTIGVYSLCSHQYALDPIIAIACHSEYTFMKFARIREPYVLKLLHKRSVMVLGITALIDAALIVLFVFVPGKRL